MTQIWITKTSDKNLQIRQQDLSDDIKRLSIKLEDNKYLLNEYNEELKKRGLIKIEAEASEKQALNIGDVSGSFIEDLRDRRKMHSAMIRNAKKGGKIETILKTRINECGQIIKLFNDR